MVKRGAQHDCLTLSQQRFYNGCANGRVIFEIIGPKMDQFLDQFKKLDYRNYFFA